MPPSRMHTIFQFYLLADIVFKVSALIDFYKPSLIIQIVFFSDEYFFYKIKRLTPA